MDVGLRGGLPNRGAGGGVMTGGAAVTTGLGGVVAEAEGAGARGRRSSVDEAGWRAVEAGALASFAGGAWTGERVLARGLARGLRVLAEVPGASLSELLLLLLELLLLLLLTTGLDLRTFGWC